MIKIDEMQEMIHALNREKGWWDDPNPNIAEKIAAAHSELSEAFDEVRNFEPDKLKDVYYSAEGKPLGFSIEMADAVIRIMDLCEYLGVNLERAIIEKYEYNKTRPYRHGNKRC